MWFFVPKRKSVANFKGEDNRFKGDSVGMSAVVPRGEMKSSN